MKETSIYRLRREIKLPFGLNEDNILVHISDVANGRKCCCICPSCRTPLVAAKGNKMQHHFRHDIDHECANGLESAIHLAAKQIIMERKKITLPEWGCSVLAADSRGTEHTEQETIVESGKVITFDTVEEEVELHGIKADIVAKARNTPLVIEIFYRHQVDDRKRLKIAASQISALEIDLSDLIPEDIKNWDTFWSCINDVRRIKWLNHKSTQATYKRLEAKLIRKIQAQEKAYQAQEKREQEKLLQALHQLQSLRSNEMYIEKLKLEGETHPAWKHTSRYLPFAWHRLPDFLNTEVPDGDWIFSCDRRVWQASFYSYFICKNKSFNVETIDYWLQKTVGCKVPLCVETIGILGKKHPQLLPVSISENRPSSWKTLHAYFKHLRGAGMLQSSGDGWFKAINKAPLP